MRLAFVLTITALAMHAAGIRGTVVENQSGHPLARALIVVEPASGANSPKYSGRTNAYGVFEISEIQPGIYYVTASRRAFAPEQYGQKRWNSAGMPLALADGEPPTLNFRLLRYGAVTGTLLDENEEGLTDQDVVIYRNTRPPVLLDRARTDDRGTYRFSGLDPGKYLIRTAAKSDEQGTYLPTFYRDVAFVDQAAPVETALDQQTDNVVIRPAAGRLFTLNGWAFASQRGPIKVTLASDMGNVFAEVDSQGAFRFDPAPPGQYEVTAESGGRIGYAAFQKISLERDTTLTLRMSVLPSVQFAFEDAQGQWIDSQLAEAQVMVRRVEPFGPALPQTVRPGRAIGLLPGRYEVALASSAPWYASRVANAQGDTLSQGRADGWNEVLLQAGSQNTVRFVLSNASATVHGAVRTAEGQPLPGIPVFLEATDLDRARRVPELRTARTDSKGEYRFAGLAPGVYRVIASYEFRTTASATMDVDAARTVRLEQSADAVQDLEAYVIK